MTRRDRYEFSKPVRRAAVKRAHGRCEAAGEVYGLEPGQRCYGDLGRGLQIDHYPKPAGDEGSDTLENAVVCCISCHSHKTRTYDIPVLAKGKRVSDKHLGIDGPKSQWATRPLGTGNHQHTATRALVRKSERHTESS